MASQDEQPPPPHPTEPTPPTPSSNFQIPLHALITTAQSTHGLLSHLQSPDDYSRYRSYLTRRLSRLRHAPPIRRILTHGAKSAGAALTAEGGGTTTAGRGKHGFRPRIEITAEEANLHENCVLVALLETERAWAAGMELRGVYERGVQGAGRRGLKAALGGRGGQGVGGVRKRYLRRLKRASELVGVLEGVMEGCCDEVTQVEGKAYGSWMRGNWFCERKDWKNACKQYAVALHLCQVLSNTSTTTTTTTTTNTNEGKTPLPPNQEQSTPPPPTPNTTNQEKAEALQRSDLFTARCHDVLQPLLRYCRYELQQQGNGDDDAAGDGLTEEDLLGGETDDDEAGLGANEFLRTKLASLRLRAKEEDDGEKEEDCVIEFRGNRIVVEDPTTMMALLRVRELEREFHGTGSSHKQQQEEKDDQGNNPKKTTKKKRTTKAQRESQFLSLLSNYDTVISTVNSTISTLSSIPSPGPAVTHKLSQSRCILGYCQHQKLRLSMERTERTVTALRASDHDRTLTASNDTNNYQRRRNANSSSTNGGIVVGDDSEARYKLVENIAHLYDSLLQDARAVASLPGGRGGGDHSITDDDGEEDEFSLAAEANVLRIRAYRAYYLGRMYASDVVGKLPEAIALYKQAERLGREALEELLACEGGSSGNGEDGKEDEDGRIDDLEGLDVEIQGAKIRAEVGALSSTVGSGIGSGRGLLERLDDFDSGGIVAGVGVGEMVGTLVERPRALEPIVCKPMFFDLGSNYVLEFPVEDLTQHIGEYSEADEGAGGFLSRWIFGSR